MIRAAAGAAAEPTERTTIAVGTDGRWLLASSLNTTHRRFAVKLMDKFVSCT